MYQRQVPMIELMQSIAGADRFFIFRQLCLHVGEQEERLGRLRRDGNSPRQERLGVSEFFFPDLDLGEMSRGRNIRLIR